MSGPPFLFSGSKRAILTAERGWWDAESLILVAVYLDTAVKAEGSA